MQADEWVKLALVIVVPLAIAAVVTLWSIKQMMYRPKKRPAPRPGKAEQFDAEPSTSPDISNGSAGRVGSSKANPGA